MTSSERRKGVMLTIAAGVVLPFLFVFFFVFPAHDPQPNDLPIGVVAPADAAARITASLTRRDDGLEVRNFTEVAEARRAISDREIYGALVTVDGQPSEVLISSAQSATVADFITELGLGSGFDRVEDVTPLAEGDPRGVTLNVLVLPIVITAILGALMAMQFAPWLDTRQRVPVAALVGILAGAGIVAFAHLIDALPGSFLAEIAVIALGVMSIALVAGGLIRLLGPPGALVSFVLILMLGNPASGLAGAPELLPTPWAELGGFMPPGALGSALRGVAYFDFAGVIGPIVVLLAWTGVGIGLNLLADRRANSQFQPESAPAG